jgi:hypothetical protein
MGRGRSRIGSAIADPCVYFTDTVRRGVMTNVDGVRTIGVSFFGTDRGLSGCALFIMGLYVLPYKDGILGRVSVRCGLPPQRALVLFGAAYARAARGGRRYVLVSAVRAGSSVASHMKV